VDIPAYRRSSGLPVADFIVQQNNPAADGLLRDWPRPDVGVDRHRGYAVQWYGLALAAAVMTGVHGFRKRGSKRVLSS